MENNLLLPVSLCALIEAHMATHPQTILAIEGGSASGKTTLSELLARQYHANVIHMDDFFLRPEQRTPERRAEIGGNLDRERFAAEVLPSLIQHEAICYRPFRCATGTLGAAVKAAPTKLTVVEGAYATHPAFGKYYDLLVFLDISQSLQKERILRRNTPKSAARFFEMWIPLENKYFQHFSVKEKSDLLLRI